jgi:hypothetical protein
MTTESYNYDHPVSGSDEIATTSVTIASGQNLAANTPLGQVTSTGKFVECDADATNGSQTPVYLTAQAVDASAGDTQAQVIKSGTFDPEQLSWHASFDATKKLTAFVGTPISLQKQSAVL